MSVDLKDLTERGLVARKRSDPNAVANWRDRSRSDIDLSRSVSDAFPARSLTIAYEAALRACAGVLDLAGYRVRTQQGHHWAIIAAAGAVLGAPYLTVLKRVDDARKYRNDDLYGDAAPPSTGQRDQAIADAETLVAELESRLSAPRPAPSRRRPRGPR